MTGGRVSDTEHDRVFRRIEIKAKDVGEFG
jgi:hypothetical protein